MSDVARTMRGEMIDRVIEREERADELRWLGILIGFPITGALFGLVMATQPPAVDVEPDEDLRGRIQLAG